MCGCFLHTIYYYTLPSPSAATTKKSTWASLLIGSYFQICEEVMGGLDTDSPFPDQELVATRRPCSAMLIWEALHPVILGTCGASGSAGTGPVFPKLPTLPCSAPASGCCAFILTHPCSLLDCGPLRSRVAVVFHL